MATCPKCGKEVAKLTYEIENEMQMCTRCASGTDAFPFTDEELDNDPEDQRGRVRVTIAIGMHFKVGNEEHVMHYPATTINVSTSGICFGWDACTQCTGYEAGGVHKDCFFHPYAINVKPKKRENLDLTLAVSRDKRITLNGFVVYTLKEEAEDIEYVGCHFTDVTPAQSRFLEELIIKYGQHKNLRDGRSGRDA